MKPFISLEEAAYLLAGNSATYEEVQSWIDLLVTQADQLQAVQSRRMQSDLPGGLSFNAEPRQWQIPTHIFNTWREANMPEKAAMQDDKKKKVSYPTTDEVMHTGLPNSERDKLLKHIAALSLALAEKSNRYKRGSAPNANQIADAVVEILEAMPDASTHGVGKSSVRESIGAGLALLTK